MRTVFLTLLLVSGASGAPQQENSCAFGEGTVTREVAGFQVRIAPYQDKEDPDRPHCSAVVRSPDDKIIFFQHDSGFAIALAGEDVNDDGIPDVVLEAFSGGAHCCWTYHIVSLGAEPGVLRTFENQYPVKFARNARSGRIEMVAADGAFDYFDGACHPCSPHARVYLRLDGRSLVDVSAEHVADYDQIIRNSRQALTPEGLQKLRALREQPTDTPGMIEVAQNALTIVLAYLYSGREAQAHQELQSMWPEYDQERMWELILATRQNGILSNTTGNEKSYLTGREPVIRTSAHRRALRLGEVSEVKDGTTQPNGCAAHETSCYRRVALILHQYSRDRVSTASPAPRSGASGPFLLQSDSDQPYSDRPSPR